MGARVRPKLLDVTKLSSKVLVISTIFFVVLFLFFVLGGGQDGDSTETTATTTIQWGQVPGQSQQQNTLKLPDSLTDAVAEVYYLDVGQSESILCRLPGGIDILIDAGNKSSPATIIDTLQALGVDSLEYLIISMPFSEYIGAAAPLIEAGLVRAICLPDIPEDKTPKARDIEAFHAAVAAHEIPASYPTQAQVIYDDPGHAIVLSVLSVNQDWKDNKNYSLVLRLEVGDTVFIFMGTAGEPAEQALHDSGQTLRADVLKLGNHGASTGTTVDFLELVKPSFCVISTAEDRARRMPDNTVLHRITGRGIGLFRTDHDGSIRFQTNGTQLAVSFSSISKAGDGNE